MTLEEFKIACRFSTLTEVDRVCHLAFYFSKTNGSSEFSLDDAVGWLVDAGGASPNRSRLLNRLRSSRETVLGKTGFRLSLGAVERFNRAFPGLSRDSESVRDAGTILPAIEYGNTRGYVESISKQINASFEHNLFDACAVLMRRLVEVLLILSFRELGIEGEIKDTAGNYHSLDLVIGRAKSTPAFGLSRNSKNSLDLFRELGNFSAHKVEYLCRRQYIEPHILQFRALVTELFHKSGLRR